MDGPICGRCGKVMTPEDSRLHPELFLHDACLTEEMKPEENPERGRRFTERMTTHLNGGSKFSTLCYDVYCDGVKTGITHTTHTSGSPKYTITENLFVCGGDTYDYMANGRSGLRAWLVAHANPDVGVAKKED